jgi:hypothetical protein
VTHLKPSIADEQPVAEPTLGELLTRAVRTAVPTRLYQLLHLALPLAVDFGFRGWWRPAALALAVTAFGAWGLADRWLWNVASDQYARPSRWRRRLVTGARLLAGTTAATLSGVLLLELFLRLLGAAPIS